MQVASLRRVLDESIDFESLSHTSASHLSRRCLASIRTSHLTSVSLNLSASKAFTPEVAKQLAHSLPTTIETFAVHFRDVDPAAADALCKALSLHVGSTELTSYNGATPRLAHLELVSNCLSADAGLSLGTMCATRPPPHLASIDFGMPAPWGVLGTSIATAITSAGRPTRPLSYFGSHRMGYECVNVPSRGLTSADLILIVASARTGAPPELRALDLSNNRLDSSGVAVLEQAISSGKLPRLCEIDLSSNMMIEPTAKSSVLSALKRNETPHRRFRLDPDADFRVVQYDPTTQQ